MSLDFNLTEIDSYGEICYDQRKDDEGTTHNHLAPITNALIWFSLIVGMPKITESNHEEFFTRVAFFELSRGAMLKTVGEDNHPIEQRISLYDVKLHIGLRTNANDYTRAQFKKNVTRQVEDDVKQILRAQKEED